MFFVESGSELQYRPVQPNSHQPVREMRSVSKRIFTGFARHSGWVPELSHSQPPHSIDILLSKTQRIG